MVKLPGLRNALISHVRPVQWCVTVCDGKLTHTPGSDVFRLKACYRCVIKILVILQILQDIRWSSIYVDTMFMLDNIKRL